MAWPRARPWPSATSTATCWPSCTSRRSTPTPRRRRPGARSGRPRRAPAASGHLRPCLHVEEIYAYDPRAEARGAYGSTDAKHPSVAYLNRQPGHYASGRLEVVRTPPHYDFVELRRTPAELRAPSETLGWARAAAPHARH